MLAYDYPILGVFWTILMLFIWIAWLFILFQVIFDIFRSKDLSGWGKAGWFLLVVILPLLGTLIYVIARGDGMQERNYRDAKVQQDAMDDYIRQTAGTNSVADELSKLSDLRDSGAISDEEYAAQKSKLLA